MNRIGGGEDSPGTVENVQNLLSQYGRQSYSDMCILCCALTSNIRTCRHESLSDVDQVTRRLIPSIKPFFFHSLAYHPVTSCEANDCIIANIELPQIVQSKIERGASTDVTNSPI